MTPRSNVARAAAAGPRAGIASPRRPAPAPDRPRHLEVVRGRPAPGRRPPRALILVAIGVTAGIVLVIVVARVLTGQTGFTESDVSQQIAGEQRQIEQLELSVAELRAPQRIYDRATKLGLVPAGHVVYLTPSPVAAASASGPPEAKRPASRRPTTPKRGGR